MSKGTEGVFKMIGATGHCSYDRQQQDYYATDPKAISFLCDNETFCHDVWECASGEDHLANALKERGYNVRTSDIVKRTPTTEEYDFLWIGNQYWGGDIITNPPYKYATEFAEKALSIIENGHKLAMFLKITFLESESRRNLFKRNPPKVVYVFVRRICCAINGDFEKLKQSAVCYAWFVWEKGFKGNPIIKWVN